MKKYIVLALFSIMVSLHASGRHEVTFYDDSGDIVSEVLVEDGNTISSFPSLNRTGYRIVGWQDKKRNGNIVDTTTAIKKKYSLYPKWETITYTVRFIVDGVLENSVEVKYGDTVSPYVPKKKPGYVFLKWNKTNSDTKGSEFNFSDPITADTTLYAKYEVKTTNDGINNFGNIFFIILTIVFVVCIKTRAERWKLEQVRAREDKEKRERLEQARKQREERKRRIEREREQEEERKRIEREREQEEERKRIEREREQEEERKRIEREQEEERKNLVIEKEKVILPKLFQGTCRLNFYYQLEDKEELSLNLEVENGTSNIMNYLVLAFGKYSSDIEKNSNTSPTTLDLKIKNRTNDHVDLMIYYGLRRKNATIRKAVKELFGRFSKYGFVYDYEIVSNIVYKLCSGKDCSIDANIMKEQPHDLTSIFLSNYKMYFYSCINEKRELETHMELTDGCGYIEDRILLTLGVSEDSINDFEYDGQRNTALDPLKTNQRIPKGEINSLGELQETLEDKIDCGNFSSSTVTIYYGLSKIDVKIRPKLNKLFEEFSKYGFIYNFNFIKHIIADLSTYKVSLICNGKFAMPDILSEKEELSKNFKTKEIMAWGTSLRGKRNQKDKKGPNNNIKREGSEYRILKELDAMIGLSSVKEEVRMMVDQVKVNKLKREAGVNTSTGSMHLVFTGNPGTGKTSVARLIGKIYFELGITKKDIFIEADRSKFVAEYLGQTAIKTKELIETARGGILFIDEAYTLNQGNNDFYGSEAVDTLLKFMEDYRENLIVIIAGYTNEISTFLHSNPGLESRFPTTIHFEDYNAEELKQIFVSMCQKDHYILTPEAEMKLSDSTEYMYESRSDNFANAREVRNLYEKVIKHQNSRLAELDSSPTKKDLMTILEEDFGSISRQ